MKQDTDKTLLRRTSILLQLQAAYPAALPLETVMRGLKLSSVPHEEITENTLNIDIAYLEEKGYLSSERSDICAAHARVKIRAKGLDHLETSGF